MIHFDFSWFVGTLIWHCQLSLLLITVFHSFLYHDFSTRLCRAVEERAWRKLSNWTIKQGRKKEKRKASFLSWVSLLMQFTLSALVKTVQWVSGKKKAATEKCTRPKPDFNYKPTSAGYKCRELWLCQASDRAQQQLQDQTSSLAMKWTQNKSFLRILHIYVQLTSQKSTCGYASLHLEQIQTSGLARKALKIQTFSFSLQASVCLYINKKSLYHSRKCALH